MTNLTRRPLAWIVVVEALVVVCLLLAAWHAYTSRAAGPSRGAATAHHIAGPGGTPLSGVSPSPSAPARPRSSPAPSPRATSTPVGGGPQLATSDSFLAAQAHALNRDQAAWYRAQWSLLQAATDALRGYIEAVVVPRVEHPGRDGPA